MANSVVHSLSGVKCLQNNGVTLETWSEIKCFNPNKFSKSQGFDVSFKMNLPADDRTKEGT